MLENIYLERVGFGTFKLILVVQLGIEAASNPKKNPTPTILR